MNLADKISDAELEVMRILWRKREPVSFTDIRIELQTTKEWEKSTINTLVRRLVDKNVIAADKKGVTYYTPNISETDYVKTEETNMINKLYGGSAKKFVAAMFDNGQLSDDDINELKEYFDMGGSKND